MVAKKKAAQRKSTAKKAVKRDAPKRTAVKPIPPGFHTITAYLSVKGAADALEFYKRAFGAKERFRMPGPGGKIGHAEMKIGDSIVMIADEAPEMQFLAPPTIGGAAVMMHVYVPNVDAFFAKAVREGAKALRAVSDQFYGDRGGALEDPFGHRWYISTHKEELSMGEIKRRMEEMMKKSA